MTEQLTALKTFADEIAAGEWSSQAAITAIPDNTLTANLAFNGDLNAANALHDEVLSGWQWGTFIDGNNERCFFVEDGVYEFETYAANPARAWLLAVIRAVIIELEDECSDLNT